MGVSSAMKQIDSYLLLSNTQATRIFSNFCGICMRVTSVEERKLLFVFVLRTVRLYYMLGRNTESNSLTKSILTPEALRLSPITSMLLSI